MGEGGQNCACAARPPSISARRRRLPSLEEIMIQGLEERDDQPQYKQERRRAEVIEPDLDRLC